MFRAYSREENIIVTHEHKDKLVAATWRPAKKLLVIPTGRLERVHLVETDEKRDGFYAVPNTTIYSINSYVEHDPSLVPVRIVRTGETKSRSEFTQDQLDHIAQSWGSFFKTEKAAAKKIPPSLPA